MSQGKKFGGTGTTPNRQISIPSVNVNDDGAKVARRSPAFKGVAITMHKDGHFYVHQGGRGSPETRRVRQAPWWKSVGGLLLP